MRNTFLVTYDLCEGRRLAKVHKIMRGFGDHLQYSVFEYQLTQADLARCQHRLSEIIDHPRKWPRTILAERPRFRHRRARIRQT